MAEITAYSNCEPLPLSDPAYDEISRGIRASWPNACITMIDRITIPPLRNAYEAWRKKLEEMEARDARKAKLDEMLKPSTLESGTYGHWHTQQELQTATLSQDYSKKITREFTAYHGTKETHVESICKRGFDPAKGKTMAHGYGIYFASQFRTSWAYTGTEADDSKMSYIFVCKLLPGRIQTGQANAKPPPGFHSRADFPSAPTIFAIPEDYMMIPEYLVRFSKRSEMVSTANPTGYLPDEKMMLRRLKESLRRIETAEKKKAINKKST
jgi:hypothetical protein